MRKPLLSLRQNTVAWIIVLTAVLYAASLSTVHATHVHFNYTNSVPVGLYRETEVRTGSYAGFCLPKQTMDRLRKDMEIVPGNCPGGFAPVLKPVVQATPEHPLIFSERGFSMDGKIVPNTAPRSHTGSGAVLAHAPFGRYSDGLWAISGFNPNSYDSRYFGPVEKAAIRFYAKPLLTR